MEQDEQAISSGVKVASVEPMKMHLKYAVIHGAVVLTGNYPDKKTIERGYDAALAALRTELTNVSEGAESRARIRAALDILVLEQPSDSPEAITRRDQAWAILQAEAPDYIKARIR